jgi:hypothetical protein
MIKINKKKDYSLQIEYISNIIFVQIGKRIEAKIFYELDNLQLHLFYIFFHRPLPNPL